MKSLFYKYIQIASALLLCTSTALADAIVRSQAMFADTIAEFYVEDYLIRLTWGGSLREPRE